MVVDILGYVGDEKVDETLDFFETSYHVKIPGIDKF
tara:strand:+ start:253 stop:360 length:108 start_codon:yes stop_codon:yes gene_type:complete